MNHFKNQSNGICPLDMSKENTAETIEAARIVYLNKDKEISDSLYLFLKKNRKGVIS